MSYGTIGTRIVIGFIISSLANDITCDGEWDLESYMRLQREVEKPDLCCHVSKVNSILEQFPSMNVKHIIQVAEKRQLVEYCRSYRKSENQLLEYVKSCCFDHRDALVKQQVEGIQELHVSICLDKIINEQLEKYAHCLYDVVTTTGDCLAKEANQSALKNVKELCPRLRVVVDCFTFQAATSCSMAAGNLFNKLFKRVVKATVRVDCGKCFHVRPDIETATTLDEGKMVATIIVLIMILFSLILLRWNFAGKKWLT